MNKTPKDCGWYDKGNCTFYLSKCFHAENNRCYKLFPRQKGEFMEWMGDMCSDCNEVICNGCDMYLDYKEELWKNPKNL